MEELFNISDQTLDTLVNIALYLTFITCIVVVAMFLDEFLENNLPPNN